MPDSDNITGAGEEHVFHPGSFSWMENVSDSNRVDRVRFAIYQCSSPAPDRAESEASALSFRMSGRK